jgi:hypothetical protein
MSLATPFNALIDTALAGHLYVLGGIGVSGLPISSVVRASISLDRSIGSWVSETALPVPLYSASASIFRSWLYVVGGATMDSTAVPNVYRAHIQLDGSLGPWETEPSLPEARAFASLVQYAGTMYLVGGDAGIVVPGSASTTATQTGSIYYNPLDLRTGRLAGSSWTLNPSTLIKSVAKHTAIVAGGTMLVSGGVYNGSGNSSTEHQSASIMLDGTIGSFGGSTGSQTIGGSSGAGGRPFFNHAAIVYVDGAGAAHVVILGGNDITMPSFPVRESYYY